MRALILGAGGMLASDLIAEASPDIATFALPHDELDVTDARAVAAAFGDAAPDIVLNCAAYTSVDGAESEPERAFRVNGEGPGIIGQAATALRLTPERRPLVVHFSTDYVFNGRSSVPYRESHPPEPLGAYGRSKLAGEEALRTSGARHLIVRTSWLFGLHGKSFPRTMWQRALEGKPTRVVNDQRGSPTYTVDLARAVWGLVGRGIPLLNNVLHIANAGVTTWYDLAVRIFATVASPDLLTPCTTPEYPTAARRPAYSALDTSAHQALAGGPLPTWQDAVDQFLLELKAEVSSSR